MYKERTPPKVWNKFGCFMHQDYSTIYPEFWSGIEEFWGSISSSEKEDLLEFTKYLTGGGLPGGMSKKYWLLSGAQILPSNMNVFLSELREKMEILHNTN